MNSVCTSITDLVPGNFMMAPLDCGKSVVHATAEFWTEKTSLNLRLIEEAVANAPASIDAEIFTHHIHKYRGATLTAVEIHGNT